MEHLSERCFISFSRFASFLTAKMEESLLSDANSTFEFMQLPLPNSVSIRVRSAFLEIEVF